MTIFKGSAFWKKKKNYMQAIGVGVGGYKNMYIDWWLADENCSGGAKAVKGDEKGEGGSWGPD